MLTTPTFITETLHLVACVQLFQTIVEVKVMAYTGLIYTYWVGFYDTPTMDNDYGCHIRAVELVLPII